MHVQLIGNWGPGEKGRGLISRPDAEGVAIGQCIREGSPHFEIEPEA